MGRKICASFVLQRPRICASPHSAISLSVLGAAEMLAPQSEVEGVGHRVKNLCLICAICASNFQNLCFHPSPAIPKTGLVAVEMLAHRLSFRVGSGAKNLCLICAICASRSQNLSSVSSFCTSNKIVFCGKGGWKFFKIAGLRPFPKFPQNFPKSFNFLKSNILHHCDTILELHL